MLWCFGGWWMFLTCVWHLDLDLEMFTGIWYTHLLNFGSLSWFLSYQEHPCPSSHNLELWRMLDVSDWGFASWYWFWYCHWYLVHPYSKCWPSILILMVQRTSMSFKSWFGYLEDSGWGFDCWSWFEYCHWSCTPMFQSLALFLDLEGTKNIHVL